MAQMKRIDEMLQEAGVPSRTETEALESLQPAHDPAVVAQAMRQGVPVETMEQANSEFGVRNSELNTGVDPVFTANVDVMDAYREAYDAARSGGAGGISGGGPVTADTVREARAVMDKYHTGKAHLEDRIVDNEEYYRLMHNGLERGRPQKGYLKGKYRRNTAWLFTSIANKVADFQDNYPEATILPRELSDEQAARQLTAVIPAILERNNYRQLYRHNSLDKTKHGCGIQMVVWDGEMADGLGDIAIRRVDPLNIYWEPGVEDIQRSANVFTVELRNNDEIVELYPEIEGLRDRLSTPSDYVKRYVYNDSIDTSDKSYIVNWYYRKRVGGRTILHYCRFVNDVVLFASENDQRYADGWYKHGRYPFVFDPMYPEVGTPFGFGEIDIGRDAQDDLDDVNAEALRNIKQTARRRWLVRSNAGVNEEEYADLDKDIVHVEGQLDDIGMREITLQPLSASVLNWYTHKIDELKETTSNRDVTQGGTGGTSTASGIAALQESGNKVSRDLIASSYEKFKEVVELIIELVRQFYDVPRTFRIVGDNGQIDYQTIDNSMMQARQIPAAYGVAAYQSAEPVFDVTVKAYKQNPYSKQQANQDAVNMYGMGFFQPDNYIQALACLELMDLPNKDKVQQVIGDNGKQWIMAQQMAAQQMMQLQAQGMAAQGAQPPDGQNKQQQRTSGATGRSGGQTVFDKAKAQAQAGTQPR